MGSDGMGSDRMGSDGGKFGIGAISGAVLDVWGARGETGGRDGARTSAWVLGSSGVWGEGGSGSSDLGEFAGSVGRSGRMGRIPLAVAEDGTGWDGIGSDRMGGRELGGVGSDLVGAVGGGSAADGRCGPLTLASPRGVCRSRRSFVAGSR